MRIVAALGIKDEVELIADVIEHLRRVGVDHVVACDMHSTDGTAEVLEGYRPDVDVSVVEISDREDHETWERKMLDWIAQADADWAIFLDADEFPIPASGSLKDCAALASSDAVGLDRFNVPLTPEGPTIPDRLAPSGYEELLLLARPIPPGEFWTRAKQDRGASWMRIRVAPRVIARPSRIDGIALGAHDIVSRDEASLRRAKADDLIVAHLPFTTRSRFERKVENIRNIFVHHDELYGDRYALHWRRWVALADQGRLDEEFDRMVFDPETIAELRAQGVIRSAAEYFADAANRASAEGSRR